MNECLKSSWPFAIATLILVLLTYYILTLYGEVHWRICQKEANLSVAVERVLKGTKTGEVHMSLNNIELLRKTKEEVGLPSSKLLGRLGYHRFCTGFASFVCSIVAFLKKPRAVGSVTLVLGLVGLFLGLIVM
jgi:hypothetical protein